MKKIRIFDIHWDTSDGGKQSSPEWLGLPNEDTFEVDDSFNPEDSADLLSDKWGYCVLSCSYEWERKAWHNCFWEHIDPSLNGYSKAIDFLLHQIPNEKLPEVIATWCNEENQD